MIKRIPIESLRPDMYIHDLNSDFIPHGPTKKKGKIGDEKVIEQIIKLGVKNVYIDTLKGADCADGIDSRDVATEMEKQLAMKSHVPVEYSPTVTVMEEIEVAKEVHNEAKGLVEKTLTDIKTGNELDVAAVDGLVSNMFDSICRNRDGLACLGRIRHKDEYLLEHSVNLSVLMSSFGMALGMDEQVLKDMAVGALLHDIGKIVIPDAILHKPTSLSGKEMEKMKQHVEFSKKMLMETDGISWLSIEIASQHHERYDGSGYPEGLKGTQISFCGRMVGIVDVYDAITADRCYHMALSPTEGLGKLLEWSNVHFDENLVHHFIRSVGVYPVGSLVKLKSGRLGIVMEQASATQLQPTVKIIYNTKQKCYTKVEILDLAKPSCQDEVEKTVNPRDYGIDCAHFIL